MQSLPLAATARAREKLMIETLTLFGRSISLYYLFWLLATFAVFGVGLLTRKTFSFSVSRSIIHMCGGLTFGFLIMIAASWICGGGELSGVYYVRMVPFFPLVALLMAKVTKDSFAEVSDYIIPLTLVHIGIAKIGCIFVGCCHGYASEWGIFSNQAQAICVPVQIYESITLLLLAVVLIVIRGKHLQKGRIFAWYQLLYGITRFGLEFLRDNEKIWNGISELAFHALAAAIIGLISLIIIHLQTRKECERLEENTN